MSDHEHDYWPTPGGGMECACGFSFRPPIEPAPKPKENDQ